MLETSSKDHRKGDEFKNSSTNNRQDGLGRSSKDDRGTHELESSSKVDRERDELESCSPVDRKYGLERSLKDDREKDELDRVQNLI